MPTNWHSFYSGLNVWTLKHQDNRRKQRQLWDIKWAHLTRANHSRTTDHVIELNEVA